MKVQLLLGVFEKHGESQHYTLQVLQKIVAISFSTNTSIKLPFVQRHLNVFRDTLGSGNRVSGWSTYSVNWNTPNVILICLLVLISS